MDEDDLAQRFESRRDHLRAVAQRMLGPTGEAEDAVQQAWLRFSRADTSDVDNLTGWLTTVVARVCLDMLRHRATRREDPLGLDLPEPTTPGDERGIDPEAEAVLADTIGRALLVVLDRLSPAERVAFVLHDLFAVPFEEIAPVVERTTTATKKLASRARHRVRGVPESGPEPPLEAADDSARRRHIVEVFLTASRGGDLTALLGVLAPDVVRRADPLALPAGAPVELRGAQTVAEGTRAFAHLAEEARLALLDGVPGLVVAPRGRLVLAIRITVEEDRISLIDVVADPRRLDRLELALLDPW